MVTGEVSCTKHNTDVPFRFTAKLTTLAERIKADRVNLVKFQWVGNDLIQRALESTAEFLESHVSEGIGITKGMQSFNVLDRMADGASYGPESSEFRLVPDPETYARVPYAPGTARFIAELRELDLSPSPTDARHALRRTIDRLRSFGLEPKASLEPEFYLLRVEQGVPVQPYTEKFGTSHSYDLLSEFLHELVYSLSEMGVRVERIKKEYGGSQIEPTIRYSDGLKAADDFVTLRDVAKGVSSKRGLVASFMPKPFEKGPASGLHLHLSLLDRNKENAFYSSHDPRGLGLSDLAYHFVAGVLEHIVQLSVFCAPTTNSYKRLRPGTWAPSHVFWGFDNRAAIVRVPSSAKGFESGEKRLEIRLGDPSANPYLYIASVLEAGLDGIKRRLEPPPALTIDPAKESESKLEELGIKPLPRTLGEAIREAVSDGWVRSVFGDHLVSEYIKVRTSEWNAFTDHVCEWEHRNYLESF